MLVFCPVHSVYKIIDALQFRHCCLCQHVLVSLSANCFYYNKNFILIRIIILLYFYFYYILLYIFIIICFYNFWKITFTFIIILEFATFRTHCLWFDTACNLLMCNTRCDAQCEWCICSCQFFQWYWWDDGLQDKVCNPWNLFLRYTTNSWITDAQKQQVEIFVIRVLFRSAVVSVVFFRETVVKLTYFLLYWCIIQFGGTLADVVNWLLNWSLRIVLPLFVCVSVLKIWGPIFEKSYDELIKNLWKILTYEKLRMSIWFSKKIL